MNTKEILKKVAESLNQVCIKAEVLGIAVESKLNDIEDKEEFDQENDIDEEEEDEDAKVELLDKLSIEIAKISSELMVAEDLVENELCEIDEIEDEDEDEFYKTPYYNQLD
jgi:hypothetical protein